MANNRHRRVARIKRELRRKQKLSFKVFSSDLSRALSNMGEEVSKAYNRIGQQVNQMIKAMRRY